MDLDDCTLDEGYVFDVGEGTEGLACCAGYVGAEEDAGTGGVEGVGRVADGADCGDGGAAAAAEDWLLEVLPEASLILQCDLTSSLILEGVDCALEEGGVFGQSPKSNLGEWHGGDDIIEVHRVSLLLKRIRSISNGDLVCGFVVGDFLDGGAKHGSVLNKTSESQG